MSIYSTQWKALTAPIACAAANPHSQFVRFAKGLLKPGSLGSVNDSTYLMAYHMLLREASVNSGVELNPVEESVFTSSRIFVNACRPGTGKTLATLLMVAVGSLERLTRPSAPRFIEPRDLPLVNGCVVVTQPVTKDHRRRDDYRTGVKWACNPLLVEGVPLMQTCIVTRRRLIPCTLVVAPMSSVDRFRDDARAYFDGLRVRLLDVRRDEDPCYVHIDHAGALFDALLSGELELDLLVVSGDTNAIRSVPPDVYFERVVVDEPTLRKVLRFAWKFRGLTEWMLLGTAQEELETSPTPPVVNIANHFGRWLKAVHKEMACTRAGDCGTSPFVSMTRRWFSYLVVGAVKGVVERSVHNSHMKWDIVPEREKVPVVGREAVAELGTVLQPAVMSAILHGDYDVIGVRADELIPAALAQVQILIERGKSQVLATWASSRARAVLDRYRDLDLPTLSVMDAKVDRILSYLARSDGHSFVLGLAGSLAHCRRVADKLAQHQWLVFKLFDPACDLPNDILKLHAGEPRAVLCVNLDHYANGFQAPHVDRILASRCLSQACFTQLAGRANRCNRDPGLPDIKAVSFETDCEECYSLLQSSRLCRNGVLLKLPVDAGDEADDPELLDHLASARGYGAADAAPGSVAADGGEAGDGGETDIFAPGDLGDMGM